MSTTLLFVELLIAGFQVIVWFVLLLFSVFGYDWVFRIQTQVFNGWQLLLSVIALAFVYVLGILFDKLADIIFSKWDRAIGEKRFGKNAPYVFARDRFQIGRDNTQLYHHFEYIRSRLRIARASSVNFAITTIMAVIFVVTRLQNIPNLFVLLFFIIVVGCLLTYLAVLTWYKLSNTYCGIIYANLPKETNSAKNKAKVVIGK